MRLGRVRRDRLAQLDAADWEFVQDFDHDGDDGHLQRAVDARQAARLPERAVLQDLAPVAVLGHCVDRPPAQREPVVAVETADRQVARARTVEPLRVVGRRAQPPTAMPRTSHRWKNTPPS